MYLREFEVGQWLIYLDSAVDGFLRTLGDLVSSLFYPDSVAASTRGVNRELPAQRAPPSVCFLVIQVTGKHHFFRDAL